MNFSKIAAVVFGIIFIAILYSIIYQALRIMNKDVKGGGRRKQPSSNKKMQGLEVVDVSEEVNVKKGSVIPVRSTVSIGRKEGNSIVLTDVHVSGNHARLTIKNNIEDLNSTNGTFVNGKKISGRVKLLGNDEVKIGTTTFKVLG